MGAVNRAPFVETWRRMRGEPTDRALAAIERATVDDVRAALKRRPVSGAGFLALLSSAADGAIDDVEGAARDLTAQRFGRVINLYIPLYLSSHCVNNCAYCGFGQDREFPRKTLTLDEVRNEGERLLREGYRNVLLVAGEDPREVDVDYLERCVKLMKAIGFAFVSVEVGPVEVADYRRLGAAGLDGVTVYQETYDEALYDRVHLTGPKKRFVHRMAAAERVAEAGIRSVGVGFLLGLADWRKEALALAAHVKYLNKTFWQTSVSISFPRIKEAPGDFLATRARPVSDAELKRLIFAMRLLNPDATLTLSTREPAALRDRLFGAGINQASAGSKTSPGAYTDLKPEDHTGEQFPVVDERTPQEVMTAIKGRGLEWVFKDWDATLKPVS